jgi:hypothetical protein
MSCFHDWLVVERLSCWGSYLTPTYAFTKSLLHLGFSDFDVVGDRGFNWLEEATMIWEITII